ncbi:hypothetical protein NQ318_021526 [Aromia moschata]|uniref:Timeless N-terminal domain-containing protein n=1 Tax=Aromia moschata TaxID=1265417 RepID=A0AAV8ZD88_9CUCU|nr:hypothetical protein NQ318_021526 [Aromia moschata]
MRIQRFQMNPGTKKKLRAETKSEYSTLNIQKPSERGEEGGLIIERILVLIRNILHVEAGYKDNRPIGDVTVHDQVLWALHQAGMLDVFLYITNTARESEYYMHMLEILTLMLKEQNANELAGSLVRRSEAEKMRDEAELLAARLREKLERQEKEKMSASSRHSRFGGTFVLKSHRAISNNKLIYHGPLSKADQLNFDEAKSKRKTPKNRAPESSSTSLHRSSLSIRLFLKDFCVEFVKGAYNDVMRYSKAYVAVMPQLTIDEPYYLMALRFFMEFNRNFEFDLTVVT